MQHLDPLISDLALILAVAGVTTLLFKWLKQPVVLGYVVAGFICSGNFLLEGVSSISNVNIWAEIGIIFLLFSLGLEFSFKKLVQVGGSSLITALTIIVGMMSTGFLAGNMLGWSTTDSIFLGGMLSMSSTTIIIKAFGDLGLKNRKFTSQVFGVLIVEDLFAVVLMVLLGAIYLQKNIQEIVLMEKMFKLIFFLVLWFIVGIYLIPTLLTRIKKYLSSETLLILSLGMCLGMVVLANYVGFSSALGAFIMGSILAGTSEVHNIEKITAPVKDLFGAIFFVSVGMLVEPEMLVQYAWPIIILTIVVIVGQIFYATLGFIISGQDLRIALQSSFSLTQIGEFAFIIASLGIALNVTGAFLYPVAVAVSVVTTFTTPFIMRLSEPAYIYINRKMPHKARQMLERYSRGSQTLNNQAQWRILLKKSLLTMGIYTILLGGVLWIATIYYKPLVDLYFNNFWGDVIYATTTIIAMTPLLWALAIRNLNRRVFVSLWKDRSFNRGLLISIAVLRIFIAIMFIMAVLIHLSSYKWGTLIGFTFIFSGMAIFWRRIKKAFLHFEYQFKANLKEDKHNRIVKIDIQSKFLNLIYLTVSPDCDFIGQSIKELNIRTRYGVTIVSISRGSRIINTPKAKEMLMPHDNIAVVGMDTQLKEFAALVESEITQSAASDVLMKPFSVKPNSVMIGMTISQFLMMSGEGCLVIGIERSNGKFVEPLSLVRFLPGDMVWIAGVKDKLNSIKGQLG